MKDNESAIASAREALELGKQTLSIGDCIAVAEKAECDFADVVLFEAMEQSGLPLETVKEEVLKSFEHNFKAIEAGLDGGESFLFGKVSTEMGEEGQPPVIDDELVNTMVVYTLAAQVGNHSVGLQPCAGTGDSCPYSGFMKAVLERYSRDQAARAAAVLLKVGTVFRAGKVTTGCNMEGYGAGSAATAAAFTTLSKDSRPADIGRAIVLALSPTIGNPCTPRVMVPGLCATHIGGAILNAKLASHLAVYTRLPINVPPDVMIAMAASVHKISAKEIVPEVIRYMEPFFRTNAMVESYIDDTTKEVEASRKSDIQQVARGQARELAAKANPIVKPFGTAVVGGSSQAVGSPTNTGRLAHHLAKGTIHKVVIDLYPELFARRGINVPGILMGAVYGASTADGAMYKTVMDKVKGEGIEVEINQVEEHQLQRVTIFAGEGNSMVDARNRGGGRLALVAAEPDEDKCREIAESLEIEIVE